MLLEKLSFLEKRIQKDFFLLEDELNCHLLSEHKKVISTLEAIQIQRVCPPYIPFSKGRPRKNRQAIVRALIAKHVLNLPSNTHLIHRLRCDKHLRYICGFAVGERVPSEATFSRAFSELSRSDVLDRHHQELVKDVFEGKLVLHCARDSMPIHCHERPKKDKSKTKKDRYSFRSKAGKKITLAEFQADEASSLDEMIAPLNTDCTIGKKTNASGLAQYWQGYKLNIDVANGKLPISCIMTSASVHDSQVAIPLSCKSSKSVQIAYELMDSAYDTNAIISFCKKHQRVPIVKKHKRKGKRKELIELNEKAHKALDWLPADEIRLKHRFSSERIFARLKTQFLSSDIRFRGIEKVRCHVMLGILALFGCELNKLE